MMIFFLFTLLHLHQIDYNPLLWQEDWRRHEAIVDQLLGSTYQPPYRINRSLPPVRQSFFVHPGVPITAQSGVVMDSMSGEILWQRHPETALPIASLTKLMTAIVFLETIPDFQKEVVIEKSDDADSEGSRLKVQPGEKVTAGDLFYASLVGSANNATKALARSTGLSAEEFVQQMNQKAQALGLKQTVFYEVTGLSPENRSTVLEYSRLSAYAFRHSRIQEALARREYVFETVDRKIKHTIKNTDELLTDGSLRVIGAKTGYLEEAGYTFVFQAAVDGGSVMVTLFNSASSQARFSEARELITWAKNNFLWL